MRSSHRWIGVALMIGCAPASVTPGAIEPSALSRAESTIRPDASGASSSAPTAPPALAPGAAAPSPGDAGSASVDIDAYLLEASEAGEGAAASPLERCGLLSSEARSEPAGASTGTTPAASAPTASAPTASAPATATLPTSVPMLRPSATSLSERLGPALVRRILDRVRACCAAAGDDAAALECLQPPTSEAPQLDYPIHLP